MAIGEQFGSREIDLAKDGGTGRRVFLTTWANNRHGPPGDPIPLHGQKWDPDVDARLDEEWPLWVHQIRRRPYGASGEAGSGEAASHCRVEVLYEGTPLPIVTADRFDPQIEVRPHVEAMGPLHGLSPESGQQSTKAPPTYHLVVEFAFRAMAPATAPDDSNAGRNYMEGPFVAGTGASPSLGTYCEESVPPTLNWAPSIENDPEYPRSADADNFKVSHWLKLESASMSHPFFCEVWNEVSKWWHWNEWTVVADILMSGNGKAIGSGHLLFWNKETGEFDAPSGLVGMTKFASFPWRERIIVPDSILVAP